MVTEPTRSALTMHTLFSPGRDHILPYILYALTMHTLFLTGRHDHILLPTQLVGNGRKDLDT